MFDGGPRHLAHHVVAQVRREVPDAELARPPRLRARTRLAVDVAHRRIVGQRKLSQHVGLDIEEEQQIQQLLQAVDKLVLVAGLEPLVAQAIEVVFQSRKVAAVLACLERLHREWKRSRASRLETAEICAPRIDAARGKQHFAAILVGGDIVRVRAQRLVVGGNGRVGGPLLGKQYAKVEMGGSEIRAEYQRALVGARGPRHVPLHLQCDAVVVMRLAVGHVPVQRLLECRGRRCPVAAREMREAQRAQQARVTRRDGQPLTAQRDREVAVPSRDHPPDRRKTRIDIPGRRRHRSQKRGACTRVVTCVLHRVPGKVACRCEVGLQREHAVVVRKRLGRIALLMRQHRRRPQLRHRPRIELAVACGIASAGQGFASAARRSFVSSMTRSTRGAALRIGRVASVQIVRAGRCASRGPVAAPRPARSSSTSKSESSIDFAAAAAVSRGRAPAGAPPIVKCPAASMVAKVTATEASGSESIAATADEIASGVDPSDRSTMIRRGRPAVRRGHASDTGAGSARAHSAA